MLDFANIAMVVSILSLLIILGFCFLPVRIRDGDLLDDALSALLGCFMVSILVTQPLIAFGLHDSGVADWRMIGLYFTAIVVFIAELPLLAEMSREILKVPIAPNVPDRLINGAMIAFGAGWLAEVAMLLTR